ncbi:MAG: helix-turn-helix transcriptional regulator [Clostridium sp.]|uniref:helix-turn-helix domain-containing protein n=1 Tax=Faecalispora jeddahensis TaxID=1414721 RepID=UPI00189BBB7A|nr:helix-turn-helix transcriptional regulator [Faecalispora jeddahensis]MDU6305534.1 helix-turn-helix transcriptional regulator [Clostridium sp.]
MKYHNRLKELREEKGLNQAELGAVFNLSQIAISQYERQTRNIPNDLIIEMAKYFNVSTDYLLGNTDRKK